MPRTVDQQRPNSKNNPRFFGVEEDDRLRREYLLFRDAGKLADLAQAMGRSKTFICTQARRLGLTDQRAPKIFNGKWKYMSRAAAAVLWVKFKRSSLGMKKFCTTNGLDDLGFARTMKQHFADEWDGVIELKAPAQSMYRVGRALEYRVRDALRARGFFVLRSPQSRSPLDLVAIMRGWIVFVQCKRDGAFGVAEWNAFLDLCEGCGALPILASQPTARGTVYHLITGPKDGTKRSQPMVRWSLQDLSPEAGSDQPALL